MKLNRVRNQMEKRLLDGWVRCQLTLHNIFKMSTCNLVYYITPKVSNGNKNIRTKILNANEDLPRIVYS